MTIVVVHPMAGYPALPSPLGSGWHTAARDPRLWRGGRATSGEHADQRFANIDAVPVQIVFETHGLSEDHERGFASGWLPGRCPSAVGCLRENSASDAWPMAR